MFYKFDRHIEIIDIPKECGHNSLIKCISFFRDYLKRNKPSILLSFSAPFNMVSIVSSIGLNIRTIVCERNDPRFIPFNALQRFFRNCLYLFADGILTQTEHNKEYFSKVLQKKTTVIYNPIFINQALIGSKRYEDNNHIIISVARLKEQKNQKMLISAFSKFSKSHPDYKLLIWGEGDERGELENQINELSLEQKVLLPGVSENIFQELSKGEIFVLSSNFEGMPNTLIEAMCLGLPCISTKVSGATDLIKDGVNGLLIEINAENQLIMAMEKLTGDDSLRKEIGENASKIYDELNVEVISNKWIKYIENFVK